MRRCKKRLKRFLFRSFSDNACSGLVGVLVADVLIKGSQQSFMGLTQGFGTSDYDFKWTMANRTASAENGSVLDFGWNQSASATAGFHAPSLRRPGRIARAADFKLHHYPTAGRALIFWSAMASATGEKANHLWCSGLGFIGSPS